MEIVRVLRMMGTSERVANILKSGGIVFTKDVGQNSLAENYIFVYIGAEQYRFDNPSLIEKPVYPNCRTIDDCNINTDGEDCYDIDSTNGIGTCGPLRDSGEDGTTGAVAAVDCPIQGKAFEFEDGKWFVVNNFYRFNSEINKWEWSTYPDKSFSSVIGPLSVERDRALVIKLLASSKVDGFKLLLEKVQANDEGGWSDVRLYYSDNYNFMKDYGFSIRLKNGMPYQVSYDPTKTDKFYVITGPSDLNNELEGKSLVDGACLLFSKSDV